MRLPAVALLAFFAHDHVANAFILPQETMKLGARMTFNSPTFLASTVEDTTEMDLKRKRQKEALFGLIGTSLSTESLNADPVLADPVTKEPLTITTSGTILGGQESSSSGVKVELSSSDNTYLGRTDSYFNLLRSEAVKENDENTEATSTDEDEASSSTGNSGKDVLNSLRVFIPPPIRPLLSRANILPDDEYIPMRDLFTSPSVSFAYERGWRQGFAAAGFPGADAEYNMVRDYFAPVNPKTVVDMSCATGLFTRRLAKGNDYDRVIGCDYSDAMLGEARNRIRSDPALSSKSDSTKTRLDLIRCDVGDIPMVSDSVDALHAGAAMHCWPDLDSALSEIHRVIKPGGRFFATTFLGTYFQNLQNVEGPDQIQQMQAFQYFESVEELENMVVKAGFDKSNVNIEVLGASCVVIKAEKSS